MSNESKLSSKILRQTDEEAITERINYIRELGIADMEKGKKCEQPGKIARTTLRIISTIRSQTGPVIDMYRKTYYKDINDED